MRADAVGGVVGVVAEGPPAVHPGAAGGPGATADPASVTGDRAADWVVRAQDGHAADVVREVTAVLEVDHDPFVRVGGLYARAVALHLLRRTPEAVADARELVALCRDLGLLATGLRGRALLVELLRRDGRAAESMEQLAHAVALEPALTDLHDPQVQGALGAVAVALRLAGVPEEAHRVEERLAPVEHELPRAQRVARWSNQAFEHARSALASLRRAPFAVDEPGLRRAVEVAGRAVDVGGGYDVVRDEAAVLRALVTAWTGDPATAERELVGCRGVLGRGPEAVAAQLVWSTAWVHTLVRLGDRERAAADGADLLARFSRGGADGDRLALAHEVMAAERPSTGGAGAAAYLLVAEERMTGDAALLTALFRARVDLLRGADERRLLARTATLDSLTGLVNRRGATAALDEAARRPDDEEVALILVDLDAFGTFNETAGHLAGDVVLQRVAGALRTAARAADVVARWGGDEFVVVAPLDAARAVALAERLLRTVRDSGQPRADDTVTASIGVAVRSAPQPAQDWLRRAQAAVHAARRAGGDRAVAG